MSQSGPRFRKPRLITAPSSLGVDCAGVERGAEAILATGLRDRLSESVDGICAISVSTPSEAIPNQPDSIAAFSRRLAKTVRQAMLAQERPVVLGGDHSVALGTWNGVRTALPVEAGLGLIWIDAHLDANIPANSPTGNYHGMSLSHLLGRGDEVLLALAPQGRALPPHRVCVVGARSWEPEEGDLLAELGVRVYPMAEVRTRGIAAVLEEVLGRVLDGAAGFGLSLDMDAYDPREAPGVCTPVRGGFISDELLGALATLAGHPRLLAIEVAECDPLRDLCGRTSRLAADSVTAIASARSP